MPASKPPASKAPDADVLRDDFEQSDFGKVILPFTALPLGLVPEPTKKNALEESRIGAVRV